MVTRGRGLWWVLAVMLAAVGLAAAGCKTTPPEETKPKAEPTGPHAALLKLLPGPQDVSDWQAGGEVKVYGPVRAEGVEALEMDLAADEAVRCRAYAYAKSATKRYTRGAGEILTLRIFEMKNSMEAFGLFSIASTGTQFPLVGLAARMSSTGLAFAKGPYLASMEYRGENDAMPVLMEFSRWIADRILSAGYRPALLENFPLGSAQGERYYLHTFEGLASLPFVPKADPETMKRMLGLGPETDVAIMGYPTAAPGVLNYVFVIRYPSEAEAQAAYTAYEGYLAGSTNPAEQNVALAPAVRMYLAGTFTAEENSVNDRLVQLLSGLGG